MPEHFGLLTGFTFLQPAVYRAEKGTGLRFAQEKALDAYRNIGM